jgi:hypothetical protein
MGMNTEEDEFRRIEAEAKRRAARDDDDDTQVYAKPWVGLTIEEINKIMDDEIGFNSCWGPEESFARAIEAKLKEKNA